MSYSTKVLDVIGILLSLLVMREEQQSATALQVQVPTIFHATGMQHSERYSYVPKGSSSKKAFRMYIWRDSIQDLQ